MITCVPKKELGCFDEAVQLSDDRLKLVAISVWANKEKKLIRMLICGWSGERKGSGEGE